MTKAQAIHYFFSQFGMAAYAATAVPDTATLPYLTYEYKFDAWDGGEIAITVKMWFYSTEEAVPNAKAQELSDAIGYGGKVLPCDGGYVWLKRGHPFCQSLSDDSNPNAKLRYINVSAEFLTLN